MGRQVAGGAVSSSQKVYGVGIDEKNAIVVDKNGRGTLLQQSPGTGAAFILSGGAATQISSGQPLIYPNISVIRIDAATQYYDFTRHCGTGTSYVVSVNGGQVTPDPYITSGTAGTCP